MDEAEGRGDAEIGGGAVLGWGRDRNYVVRKPRDI